jgi:hypothetical protein
VRDEEPEEADCPACTGTGEVFDYGLQGEAQYACGTCGTTWCYEEQDEEHEHPIYIG